LTTVSSSAATAIATPTRDFGAAVKDGLFAGLVALGIFGPLIGFKTVSDMQNRLTLETRWGLLASMVLVVAVGRFLISFYWRRRSEPAAAKPAFVLPAVVSKGLSPAALIAVFAYPLLIHSITGSAGSLKWIDNFGVQILIYIMLAWGLNIVVGLAGLLDLGYVAFYAVGAYS
jgi:branched-chain amino acid transport system permease protein